MATSDVSWGGEPYIYEKLLTENYFRLLFLLPGKADDTVEFELVQAPFGDAPDYEAISYRWEGHDIPTLCDGRTLAVGASLHTALRRLRYEDRPRVLWADAICINQGDVPEKNNQVQQMLQVYRNAQCVVVWLGEDEDDQAEIASQTVDMIYLACLAKFLGKSVSGLKLWNRDFWTLKLVNTVFMYTSPSESRFLFFLEGLQ
jgi:hypothetical protein